MKLIEWIKNNKSTTVLIVIAVYYVGSRMFLNVLGGVSNLGSSAMYMDSATESAYSGVTADMVKPSLGNSNSLRAPSIPYIDPTPQPDIDERKIVRNSQVSLLVENVRDTTDKIIKEAEVKGGYMVDSSVNSPTEGGSGTLQIRIPSDELDNMLKFLRENSVKVVSERIQGRDVTDQYTDIEERLRILERNKARYEEIMESAEDIDEILRVQNQIFNLQSQIDSYTGQLNKLDATSRTSLVTISLSTDELALPYSPGTPWRPEVVFKTAVRSLNLTLRSLGNGAIWIAVYAVVWLPAIVLYKVIRARWKKKRAEANPK